jgi:hypothetical protein
MAAALMQASMTETERPPARTVIKGTCVMDRFIRRENVKHYLRLLDTVTDPVERERIQKLLEEERRKQIEAGDIKAIC